MDDINSDLEKFEPPAEGAVDKALAVGRNLVSPVADLFVMPGSGAAVSFFSELIKTPYERRLQRWQENIGAEVISLSKSRKTIVSDLKASEEFQSILIQATQAAIRSHQEDKISALASRRSEYR